jgi:lipopolysaccharide export system permease protein
MSITLLCIATVMLVLLVMTFLSVVAEEFGDMENNYGFREVVMYAVWRIPGYLLDNLGFSTLVGCLAALGILSNNNELTVIRATGISKLQIFMLVMRPVVLVIVAGMLLGEVTPHSDRIALGMKALAKQDETKIGDLNESQVWSREGNEFVRFNTVLANGKVYDVTRFIFDDNKQLLWTQNAQQGTYANDQWLFEQVRTEIFSPEKSVEELDIYKWETSVTPEVLTFVATEPDKMSISELRGYRKFLDEQGQDKRKFSLELWRKVLLPAEILSLVLIAMCFVFGSLRQVTMGFRVFVGVITGLVFKTFQNVLGQSSLVYGFSPEFAALFPIMICAALGLVLLYRVR